MKATVTLIVPCYNEEESLPIFYSAVCDVARQLPNYGISLLLVNDGSKDGTLKVMRDLAAQDERVQYLSFSRNFGKEAAMYAGFCNAKGDYVAVMDADMQDPPSLLPEMLQILETGEYDSVATRRVTRDGEPPIRSFFARMFYKLINRISEADIVDGARDFRLMKREMVDAIVSMCEYNRFSKGIFGWIGFKTKWLPYKNVERVAGETKWSFFKLFKYSLDGIVHRLGFRPDSHGHRLLYDPFRGDPPPDLRRSRCGLGFHRLHHPVHRRRSASVHGHHGAVSGKDLFGSKKSPAFYHQRNERQGRQAHRLIKEDFRFEPPKTWLFSSKTQFGSEFY